MLDKMISWVTAFAAVGGMVLSVINLLKARSKTTVTARWELHEQFADVPFEIDASDFVASYKRGVNFLLPGVADQYSQQVDLQLVVRVSRFGSSPENVEYIELGNAERRVSFTRTAGQFGSAVKVIDPNSHSEWAFNFNSLASSIAANYPNGDFPEIEIRVATGGKQKYLRGCPRIDSSTLGSVVEALQLKNLK